jgi:hypothetical protein
MLERISVIVGPVFFISAIIFRLLKDVLEYSSTSMTHTAPIVCVIPILVEVNASMDTFFGNIINISEIVCKVINHFQRI